MTQRFGAPVFAALLMLTGLSWLTAEGHFLVGAWPTVVVMTIAAVKLHLVGMHFMEMRHAPRALTFAFHIWIVAVWAVVIGLHAG